MVIHLLNTPVCFILQIVTESFLEDINNVLNSGEVPNLYAPDEMEKLINMTRPLAKGKRPQLLGVMQYTVSKSEFVC